MFEIRKDIPLPERKAATRYPFGDMEPGDSFDIPLPEGVTMENLQRRVRNSAQAWRVNNNRSLSFTTQPEQDGRVLRVWCVKARQPKDVF